MKHILLFCLIGFLPRIAASQDSINPYNTQLPNNIILQNTDVYYNPFEPPALTDTSWVLSSQSAFLTDSDGIFTSWPNYEPRTHGVNLQSWAPHGTALGIGAHWQRFFTAKRQGGVPSDIIVGSNVTTDTMKTNGHTGPVIISKNEDVDFRASGTVKMENGFHVMPGAHFHAYQEPKYDSVVFSDDFDSSTINRAKWYVSSGTGDGTGTPDQCSTDSNVVDTLDPDATDGHALDIIFRQDTCQCANMSYRAYDSCIGTLNPNDTTPYQASFSSATVWACPWPYQQRDTLPLVPAYQHSPYGKFEIREKVPHFVHHLNDWLFGSYEIDINESTGPPSGYNYLIPNFHQSRKYGPFKGMFHKAATGVGTDSVVFVSGPAQWSWTNAPNNLFINNFPYQVSLDWNPGAGHNKDTLRADPSYYGFMGWPASLSQDTTDSVSFYYSRYTGNGTDSITWKIGQDSYGKWRKLYAPYRISGTDTFRFSKAYQPTNVTLHNNRFSPLPTTYRCHWEYNLNNPIDSGIIYLDQYDTFGTYLHSNTEKYSYTVNEGTQALPAMPFDLGDSTGGYMYHTFAVEILPHEMRYLMDSNVIYRFTDRMLPLGNPSANPAFDQCPLELQIGEEDGVNGVDSASFVYAAAHGWPGFRNVNGHPAAHRLIDYIRYWDVPADVKIPNFPH